MTARYMSRKQVAEYIGRGYFTLSTGPGAWAVRRKRTATAGRLTSKQRAKQRVQSRCQQMTPGPTHPVE